MIPAVQLELPLRFYRRIQCAAAQLSDPDHHLRRKKNGYYQLRVTIDRGPKLVGERVVFGLDTKVPEEARSRRDFALKVLRKAGKVLK
ncbi:hypothetical protein [Luteolibacter luteus]|uniref:Uncharacterized protein n=1 Tax=Luteolibacter luteus TaxID=2728835 RepID=A0A858RHT3_9BACT|nr:hypothetical protein [Luteolibacter luteus]QJE95979.1 hypothetical protein HHL09_09355 [Luteolibacter luteus]